MSDKARDTVYVIIQHFSGMDEGDALMFTTEGESLEELLQNIGECLALAKSKPHFYTD